MSTMFPNGLLLNHLLHRPGEDRLASGALSHPSIDSKFDMLSRFSGIDYTTMVDDPQKLVRALGLSLATPSELLVLFFVFATPLAFHW